MPWSGRVGNFRFGADATFTFLLNTKLLATYVDKKREELFTTTFSKLKVLSLASTTSKEAHIRF